MQRVVCQISTVVKTGGQRRNSHKYNKNIHLREAGWWFHPSEKYARQKGNLPPIFGVKIKNI